MRAHILENGVVTNTIEVESLDFMPGLVEAAEGGIGWRYENGELLPPLPVVIDPQEIRAAMVCTRRQFKLALLESNLLDIVEAAIAASTDRGLQITYAEAIDFQRLNPFVLTMLDILQKTQEEADEFFLLAMSL